MRIFKLNGSEVEEITDVTILLVEDPLDAARIHSMICDDDGDLRPSMLVLGNTGMDPDQVKVGIETIFRNYGSDDWEKVEPISLGDDPEDGPMPFRFGRS